MPVQIAPSPSSEAAQVTGSFIHQTSQLINVIVEGTAITSICSRVCQVDDCLSSSTLPSTLTSLFPAHVLVYSAYVISPGTGTTLPVSPRHSQVTVACFHNSAVRQKPPISQNPPATVPRTKSVISLTQIFNPIRVYRLKISPTKSLPPHNQHLFVEYIPKEDPYPATDPAKRQESYDLLRIFAKLRPGGRS